MKIRRWLAFATLAALSIGLGGADNCQGTPGYRVINLRPGGDLGIPCAASLQWDPPNPLPPAGIDYYEVFRSGVSIASARGTTMSDQGWLSLFPSYTYSVRAVDNSGVAHGSRELTYAPQSCPPPAPDPELRTFAFRVKFAGAPSPAQASEVKEFLFGETNSVRSYWEEVSYHSQTLTNANNLTPMLVELPYPASFYCDAQNSQGHWTGCNPAMMTGDFISSVPFSDWSTIERSIMVLYGCEDRGQAYGLAFPDGSRVKNVIIPVGAAMDIFDVDITVHELGHAAGASHASTVVCPNGGFPPDPNRHTSGGCSVIPQTDGYRDYWDPMGKGSATNNPTSGDSLQHFNAYHKELMGFFSIGSLGDPFKIRVVTPTAGGVGAAVWPLEQWGPYYGDPYVLKIPLNDVAHYSVEYRRTPPRGFIIRLVQGRRGGSLQASTTFLSDLPAFLDGPGSFFEDPTQNVRIEFVEHFDELAFSPAWVRIRTANP